MSKTMSNFGSSGSISFQAAPSTGQSYDGSNCGATVSKRVALVVRDPLAANIVTSCCSASSSATYAAIDSSPPYDGAGDGSAAAETTATLMQQGRRTRQPCGGGLPRREPRAATRA